MAIGDNENDLSMLEYAGLAVAMGNGEDYVKEIADFVTLSNDESGVAYAINKFVLNK
jgi:hydroxymethylpyrimidine pyrophosphatase-like HAD family hydrolase